MEQDISFEFQSPVTRNQAGEAVFCPANRLPEFRTGWRHAVTRFRISSSDRT